MRIYEVDPRSIEIQVQPSSRQIKYQAERLIKEGQIEPILLKNGKVWLERAWIYSEVQILAAIELGWNTILVMY